MNLHEYQAKALLTDYGILLPNGGLAASAEAAAKLAEGLGGAGWAVKAQVHAGQRGKAGGVKVVSDLDGVTEAARGLLGKRLVTGQTGREGLLVKNVYVEQALETAREIYAAVMVDRSAGQVVVILSDQGGVEVESALARGEGVTRLAVDKLGALPPDTSDRLVQALNLSAGQAGDLAALLAGAVRAFYELDASLIEFNPLGITTEGPIVALDVKMVLDDNALFRHDDLAVLRDEDETDPQEREAHRFELNYVRLDGNIGVMATGAGLALATNDLIKQRGGEPANFMDVRPVASPDQVAEGIRLLLGDRRVKVLLVHAMGGGILRCDRIADGIAKALRQGNTPDIPVVFCAVGTAKETAELSLRNQNIAVSFTDSLDEAVDEALRLAQREAN